MGKRKVFLSMGKICTYCIIVVIRKKQNRQAQVRKRANNFTQYDFSTLVPGSSAVYSVDIDGDGYLDIISPSGEDSWFYVFENLCGGTAPLNCVPGIFQFPADPDGNQ